MRPPAGVGTADPFAPNAYYLSNRFLSFPAWGGADAKAVYHSCRCGASGQSGAGGRGIAWLLGHPASYRLCYFIAANLLLGAFNLLPIHGLDGWQINSNLGILFHFKIQTQKHSCVN